MKRYITFLLALLLTFTCVFTSCNGDGDKIPDPTDDMADDEPYRLSYTPNGDGTCAVTGVLINPRYKQEFDFVIPDTSPDGDTVTEINWGKPFVLSRAVPHIMTTENYNWFVNDFKSKYSSGLGGIYGQYYNVLTKFENLYKPYNYDKLLSSSNSDEYKSELLTQHPVIEHTDVTLLIKYIKPYEYHTLAKIIASYFPELNVNVELEALKTELTAKKLSKDEIKKIIQQYTPTKGVSSEWVKSITLPSGLKTINEGAFDNFTILPVGCKYREPGYYNSQIFAGADLTDDALLVLYLSDFKTIYSLRTEPIRFDLDFCMYRDITYYSKTQPNHISSYNYWHYVDGVPTLWEKR